MRTFLLILGILLLAGAAGCLFMSLLNYWGYMRLMDGTPQMYKNLLQGGRIFLACTAVCGLLGGLCLFLRKRIGLSP